jgi:hypothetical protein
MWTVMRNARLGVALLAVAACGNPDDRMPSTHDQRVATTEDHAVVFALDGSDPDGDALAWAVSQPAHGKVVVERGVATYQPQADFAGSDIFEVVASDGERSASAFVIVDVEAVAEPPRPRADSFAAVEDEPLYLAVEGLLANDADPDGDSLRVIGATALTGGTVALADGEVVFTPTDDRAGPARFTYTVTDGRYQAEAEVTLRVTSVDDAPILTGDVLTTDEDTPLVAPPGALLRNDIDRDGDTLFVSEAHDPIGGTVELLDGGMIRFVPAPDFHGDAGFLYRASDGLVDSEAWVTVVVGSVLDLPVAGELALAGLEDQPVIIPTSLLRAQASDGDGDPLLVVAADKPVNGTVVLAGDRVRFVPTPDASGAAGFRYVVSDGEHLAAARIELALGAVDDPPIAFGQAMALKADASVTFSLGGVDVDSDGLVREIIEPPVHGILEGSSSGDWTYVPEAGFTGQDELGFVVHAGGQTSVPARVVFFVEAPAAND